MKQRFLIIIGIIALLAAFYFYLYPKLTQPLKQSEYKEVVITLERTLCYGLCPNYKLTIFGDGKVVYEGKNFVKVTGIQTAQISQNKVKELVDEFNQI